MHFVELKISLVNPYIPCLTICVEYRLVLLSLPCSVRTDLIKEIFIRLSHLGAFKVDLNQCEELYKHFSSTVFQRSKALGISSLLTSQSYYDTKSFEAYLK